MEIQGRILKLGATQAVSATFQKREVVIITEEQYPQYIPFDFVQGNCAQLDAFQENQMVRISFTVRGREWTNPQGETKYIVTLQGFRIEPAEAYTPQGYAAYPPQGYGQPAQGYGQAQYQQAPPQYQQMPQQYQQMPPQGMSQQAPQATTPQQAFGMPTAQPMAATPAEDDDLPF